MNSTNFDILTYASELKDKEIRDRENKRRERFANALVVFGLPEDVVRQGIKDPGNGAVLSFVAKPFIFFDSAIMGLTVEVHCETCNLKRIGWGITRAVSDETHVNNIIDLLDRYEGLPEYWHACPGK